jgi:hypothetical protein
MTSEPLSPSTSVLLLADHQTGVLDYVVKSPSTSWPQPYAPRGSRPAPPDLH